MPYDEDLYLDQTISDEETDLLAECGMVLSGEIVEIDHSEIPILNSSSVKPIEQVLINEQQLKERERWRVCDSVSDCSSSSIADTPFYIHYCCQDDENGDKADYVVEENALTSELTVIPLINAGVVKPLHMNLRHPRRIELAEPEQPKKRGRPKAKKYHLQYRQ